MQLIKVFDIHYVGTFTLPNTFKIFDCFFFYSNKSKYLQQIIKTSTIVPNSK